MPSGPPPDPSRDTSSIRRVPPPFCPSVSFPTFGLATDPDTTAEHATALVGTWIEDRYRIEELIGQGGFGWVYRAQQKLPEREVAIKVPRHAARMSRRFRKEAHFLGKLEHEAIARVYDAGEFTFANSATTYVVMELIKEAKPIDVFCAHTLPSVTQRVELFVKICDAVAYAHRKGIVHRDLKPSNILVAHDGRPRVIDFGIATFFDSDNRDESHTVTGTPQPDPTTATFSIVGTPKYMSPEQLSGGKGDFRSDVFALGKVLYDVVTAGERDSAASLGRRLPDDLETIKARCLKEAPTDRYADAGHLADALRGWLASTKRHRRFEKTLAGTNPQPRLSRGWAITAALAAATIVAFIPIPYPVSPPQPDEYVAALTEAERALAAENRGDAVDFYRMAARAHRNATPGESSFPVELVILGNILAPAEGLEDLLPASSAAADPSGNWLATGDEMGQVRLSLLGTPASPLYRLSGLRAEVTALRFSTNGKYLVGGDADGRVSLWEIESIEADARPRRLVALDAPSQRSRICGVDISFDESRVAIADASGLVCVWDCDTGKRLAETDMKVNPSRGPMTICFGQQDDLFIGCPDGTLFIWEDDQSPRRLYRSNSAGPIVLSRTIRGDMVASVDADSALHFHAGDAGHIVGAPRQLLGTPQTAAWSPDSSRLLVARRSMGGHETDTASAIDVIRMVPANGDISAQELVTLPLSTTISALSLAADACVAVFDAPARGMTVWDAPQILNKENPRPSPP